MKQRIRRSPIICGKEEPSHAVGSCSSTPVFLERYRDHPKDRGADAEIFHLIVDPKRGDGTYGHKTSD